MITRIDDVPVGTIGFEASGRVTEEDYREVLGPAIRAALKDGELRLLYIVPEDTEYAPGAVLADAKLWAGNLKGWKRVAIVTDADWLEKAIKGFGWLMPGKVRVFEEDDVRDAKVWLVGIDDD